MGEAIVPITGRRLALPEGPIFHLKRAPEADYEIGAFRRWAGYKNLGADEASGGLAHFQHVLSFGSSRESGRTGVHVHLAHAHIVIPTSGRGVFSYDGVVTETTPGTVIVQHGGTVHDQFDYSYADVSDADNARTPQSVDPARLGEESRSFGFLELFVPKMIADVEIVPPEAVSADDQRSAWDHPYHAAGARFSIQTAHSSAAVYRPVSGRPDLEVRDGGTWEPSGQLVAVWFVRPAGATAVTEPPVSLGASGERGGLEITYMVAGSARFLGGDGGEIILSVGDTLTCRQGQIGDPLDVSPDMRLVRIFIAAKAETLWERTPEEIERLEALGPRIITGREVRPDGDRREINGLHQAREATRVPA